ncbi:MAG: SpoVR family protein [candidate division WOR-3 bacterium]
MPKIDKKIIEDLEALVKAHNLDPCPVEWIVIDNEEIADVLMGRIPYDVEFWEDGYAYWQQSLLERDWTKNYVIGVLEVIYDMGDYAIGFIRSDMPIAYQVAVILHAYAHADLFKNHVLKQKFYNPILSYTSSVSKYRNILRNYEEKYGIDFVESVEDISEILSEISSSFRENEIQPSSILYKPREKFDPEKKTFIIEEPEYPSEDEGDILYALMSIPWIAQPIRDIISIFRHRAMYSYPLTLTKYIHEGWSTFWEKTLYIEAVKYLNVKEFITSNLIPRFPYIPKEHLEEFEKGYLIYLAEIVDILYKTLSDPYALGYLFFLYKSRKGENIFNYSRNLIDYQIFEAFDFGMLLTLLEDSIPLKFYDHIKEDENIKMLIKFSNIFWLQRIYKGYVPRGGISKDLFTINLYSRPEYEIEFERKNEPLRVGEKLYLYIHDLYISSNPTYGLKETEKFISQRVKNLFGIKKFKFSFENE